MTVRFIYDIEYNRTMRGIINDSRENIPEIKNQLGVVMKTYADEQAALVTENSLPYKMETDAYGNLAGYVILGIGRTEQSAYLLTKQLRPAFEQFSTDISEQISNFITEGTWKQDILF